MENYFHNIVWIFLEVGANLWELVKNQENIASTTESILHGDFECTLDDKGRILLPVALKKQLPTHAQNRFVIARGDDEHAVIYPYNVWIQYLKKLGQLNRHVKENREFVRMVKTHSAEAVLDANGRLSIPKNLIGEAGIKKDIVLKGSNYLIEVWAKEIHDKLYGIKPSNFAELAQQVGSAIDMSDFQF